MMYAEFLSIMTMLAGEMGYVLTGLDGVVLCTMPSSYELTLLDMLLGAWVTEELLTFVMEI